MKYYISIDMEVDPAANFLTVDDMTNTQTILDLVSDALYEIDDIEITNLEVEYVDD